MSNTTNSIRLHRVLRAPAERLYRAFLDPDAMAKWLPPYGFTGKVRDMDARVGGGCRMACTNFSTGRSHSFGGRYIELTSPREGPSFVRATRLARLPLVLDHVLRVSKFVQPRWEAVSTPSIASPMAGRVLFEGLRSRRQR
jgi:hypothetical protein